MLQGPLGNFDGSQSLHLGTPRKIHHSNNALVGIYGFFEQWKSKLQCWLLRESKSEWLNKVSVQFYPYSFASRCITGDEIFLTGGGGTKNAVINALRSLFLTCTGLLCPISKSDVRTMPQFV